jgi:hypothetical protein
MASVLDTIADHLQHDPAARHLFREEDSETSTILENEQNQHSGAETHEQRLLDDDVVMTTNQEYNDKERIENTRTKQTQATQATNAFDTTSVQYTDSSIPKSILRDSRTKRNHTSSRVPVTTVTDHDPDNPSSPQRTPPPKRERSAKKPSAIPDRSARERGAT